MVDGGNGRQSKLVGSHWWDSSYGRAVNRENVRWAIVEPVAIVEVEFHSDEAVVTIKPDFSGPSILETGLHQGDKDITRSKDRLGGDYGLDRIFAIEAQLPVGRAVRECQRKVPPTGAQIIQCGSIPINSHRDR